VSAWVWSASAATTVAARSRRQAAAGSQGLRRGRRLPGAAPAPHGWCGPSRRAGGPGGRLGRVGRRAGSCHRPRPPAGAEVGWEWPRLVLVGQPSADGQVQRVGVDAGQHAAHGRLGGWPEGAGQWVAACPSAARTGPGASAAHSPIAARDLAPASTAATPPPGPRPACAVGRGAVVGRRCGRGGRAGCGTGWVPAPQNESRPLVN